jgi:hypothetical protein
LYDAVAEALVGARELPPVTFKTVNIWLCNAENGLLAPQLAPVELPLRRG